MRLNDKMNPPVLCMGFGCVLCVVCVVCLVCLMCVSSVLFLGVHRHVFRSVCVFSSSFFFLGVYSACISGVGNGTWAGNRKNLSTSAGMT